MEPKDGPLRMLALRRLLKALTQGDLFSRSQEAPDDPVQRHRKQMFFVSRVQGCLTCD